MDSIDAQLLRILAEDARCSATDISKKVNLSIPAVNKRISRLRENGIIERFTIQLNPQKINSSVQAFVMLVVDQYSRVNELLEFVNAKENIVDCYAITGEYDYQLRLYARDITELESILLELKGKKCVSKSHTIFVLMEHKHMLGPFTTEPVRFRAQSELSPDRSFAPTFTTCTPIEKSRRNERKGDVKCPVTSIPSKAL